MRLPWQEGGPARFLCDTMMEGLARQLRMFGIDAASVPGGGGGGDGGSPKRHITYRWEPLEDADGRVQGLGLMVGRFRARRPI